MKTKSLFFLLFFCLVSYANVNGVDTQLFKPTTGGLDFITVHSTKTLPTYHFNTGLFLNASFNSLVESRDKQQYTSEDILFSSDINFGYGIMKNLEMGFNAPAVIYHHASPRYEGLYFEDNGFLELALNFKYTLIPRTPSRDWGIAVIPSMNYPVVQDPYFIGRDKNPIFNLELATDMKFNEFITAFNIGYRYRRPGKDWDDRYKVIDDQVIASTAISYFNEKYSTGITLELYGATEMYDRFDSETTPLEVLLALKYNPAYNLSCILKPITKTSLFHGFRDPMYK